MRWKNPQNQCSKPDINNPGNDQSQTGQENDNRRKPKTHGQGTRNHHLCLQQAVLKRSRDGHHFHPTLVEEMAPKS